MKASFKTRSLKPLLLLGALALAPACGGDDGGDSGIEQSKELSALTDSEIIQLCETSQALVSNDQISEGICYLFSADEDDCEMAVDECIESQEEDEGDPCEDAVEGFNAENCSATVGELESCFRDQADSINDFTDGLTCENVNMRENPFEGQPASCDAIDDMCPNLFADS